MLELDFIFSAALEICLAVSRLPLPPSTAAKPAKHFQSWQTSLTDGTFKMANALTPILAYKQDEVAALKARTTESTLRELAARQPAPRGFAKALCATAARSHNALICELKRKSPSAGEILPGADPVEIAREYEQGGATCLSVLTDEPSFGGALSDLEAIRKAVSIPLLRKDFMVDPIQIVEARAHGADAILIIMAALSDAQAATFEATAHELGMDALIEVHTEEELERALKLKSSLLGINNRDLTRMVTDLSVTERLSILVPADRHLVSESGVKAPDDISRLRKCGAQRFLIGESLMKQSSRTRAVQELVTAK